MPVLSFAATGPTDPDLHSLIGATKFKLNCFHPTSTSPRYILAGHPVLVDIESTSQV